MSRIQERFAALGRERRLFARWSKRAPTSSSSAFRFPTPWPTDP
jgi:hypothetical protein